VRELLGVPRLVKVERAKGLYLNENDVCVESITKAIYTWEDGQGLDGQAHAQPLRGAVFRHIHLAGRIRELKAEAEGRQSSRPFSLPNWQTKFISFLRHYGRVECWLIQSLG
jgi:hypothetical protein